MAGGGDEMKLLSTWFSPFGSRVKLALHLKGLSYEYVEEDLTNKSQLLLESNPVHKKVPVLFHKGKALCESMVIVDYIEEAFADAGRPPLLPSDLYERAIARWWSPGSRCPTAPGHERRWARGEADARGGGDLGGRTGAVLQGEALLRRRQRRYVDVALGGLLDVGARVRGTARRQVPRRRQDPAPGGLGQRFASLDAAKTALPDFGRVIKHAMMRRGAAAAALAPNN
ncbi:unnamed protein product [Miscanthus lutarioriparius]|uniref:Glutathione S-transferase n=1 Tax=Miscanthus lutarioriparius TaxID=422564 RepID=A0A811SER1_9POAL|nr:unnamed protein product [Miscanthus lutarioriparius]